MMDGFSAFIGALMLFVAAAVGVIGFSFGMDAAATNCKVYGKFVVNGGHYECRKVEAKQ